MNANSLQLVAAPAIKSVSLADLQFDRPSRFDWLKSLTRTVLMLWGALSFGAAAGTAAYYFAGSSGEPILVSQTKPAPDTLATVIKSDAALADIAAHASDDVALPADPPLASDFVVEARLPRPRPDEPVYTGSIEIPRPVHVRHATPCEALARLGARFFGLRCREEARAYAPPPRPHVYYSEPYPEPYQPPYVVR